MYSDLHHDSYQRLHDAAMRQAAVLRQQAFDDFWRRLGHAMRRGLRFTAPGKAGVCVQAK